MCSNMYLQLERRNQAIESYDRKANKIYFL